jgi:hypothetical protein
MSSSSKTNSSPDVSPEVAAEIARLMRDPDSMRAEAEHMRRSGGGGHYDPNQPRVPAGDPKGGQFASKGYRGGGVDHDARVALASLDGAQLAQLGQGSARDAQAQPFEGQLGHIRADQHLTSQSTFRQIDSERRRRNDERHNFQIGRYRFLSTGAFASEPIPGGGRRWVISSTTYVYDSTTGAHATISATPARPVLIDYDGKLRISTCGSIGGERRPRIANKCA